MADIEAKPHGNVSVAGLREETTWGRLIKRIQLQPQPGSEGKWTNADVFYWTNDATAPGNLRLGSSLWSMGLSWKLVLVTIALGHAIMTIALTFNGVIGARFHIPYTIQSRASFGFYFSFAMVVVRMIVAAFWYGINTYTGADCVDTIIRAIWPRFADIPNHLPESANITTEMMIRTSYTLSLFFLSIGSTLGTCAGSLRSSHSSFCPQSSAW
ncbi:permease for cytosine/purines, uracil, thiamine, allantoin-domain-containing protein [Phyllosticta citricarpa]